MAYTIDDQKVGWQAIADTDTVQRHALGTIVRANDPVYGYGEFIYLKGVSSTVVGSFVTYNYDDWTTTLLVANAIGPVAIAMSINNAATNYGWYQITGKALAKAAVVANDGKVYIDTVPGWCDDAAVAGDKVHNAKWASASTAAGNIAEVEIARPFCTDEST
jgi:hypothetical protein